MITIIDYGVGNLGSISNMFKRIGVKTLVTNSAAQVSLASAIILPGVGSFDAGARNLDSRNLRDIIKLKVDQGIPLLGICLGMQLLFSSSAEGSLPGLDLISGSIKKFCLNDLYDKNNFPLRTPHMGWNTVTYQAENILFSGLESSRFYFVHSFYAPLSESYTLGTTHYGISFSSAVNQGNIFGVQFHPEKSHKYGMRLLQNFIAVSGHRYP